MSERSNTSNISATTSQQTSIDKSTHTVPQARPMPPVDRTRHIGYHETLMSDILWKDRCIREYCTDYKNRTGRTIHLNPSDIPNPDIPLNTRKHMTDVTVNSFSPNERQKLYASKFSPVQPNNSGVKIQHGNGIPTRIDVNPMCTTSHMKVLVEKAKPTLTTPTTDKISKTCCSSPIPNLRE